MRELSRSRARILGAAVATIIHDGPDADTHRAAWADHVESEVMAIVEQALEHERAMGPDPARDHRLFTQPR